MARAAGAGLFMGRNFKDARERRTREKERSPPFPRKPAPAMQVKIKENRACSILVKVHQVFDQSFRK